MHPRIFLAHEEFPDPGRLCPHTWPACARTWRTARLRAAAREIESLIGAPAHSHIPETLAVASAQRFRVIDRGGTSLSSDAAS